ncbi:MAG: hypothetical protein WD225_08895 [Ilumatobacteraceae bacterium]
MDRRPPRPTPTLDDVLERAAELQQVVPGAVLVGGSAAAHHAGHRLSFAHDHVVDDLGQRFDVVLDNLEALGDWSTARVSSGKIILGELGGIETGVRQMFRARPLEVEQVDMRGKALTVPTLEETLRIKAWLCVQRNQTRDYLDVAALSDRIGVGRAADLLSRIDDYYDELNQRPETVATQLARQLADPHPRDAAVTQHLAEYKQLDDRWHDWSTVVAQTRAVAVAMVGVDDADR